MAADHPQPSDLVRPGEPPLPAFWIGPRWKRGLPALVRDVVVRGGRDGLTTSAASLAYYVMLVAFPAAVAVAAAANLLGQRGGLEAAKAARLDGEGTGALLDAAQQGGRAAAAGTPGWIAIATGFAFAIYGLSRYVGGFTVAAATIRGVAQPDDFLRRLPRQLLIGLVILVLMVLMVVVFGVSSNFTRLLGDSLDLGDVTTTLSSVIAWTLFLLCGTLILAVLYASTPGSSRPLTRIVSWGSFIGSLSALLVSVGFSLWVRYFADYGRVYGFLGSIVMVLTWLWLVNLALLCGLELDECLRRRRADRPAGEGRPAGEDVAG
ncbi:MAG: YihY/virulence factor BrkB family protein [Actinobacteria bacterium]|nr:YihY/virulence factor BrkB family protein [Actinomycetota bacterium]